MLAAVALDPLSTAAAGRLERDALLDRIHRFGVLALSREEILLLRDLLKEHAPSEWQRWQEVILAVPHAQVAPSPVRELQLAALERVADFDTIYVADGSIVNPWLDQMGVSLEEGCGIDGAGAVEVVRLDSLFRSRIFTVLDGWSNRFIPSSERRDTFWNQIRPLMLTSHRMTFVDRYVIANGVGCLSSPPTSNGLEWIVQRMASLPSSVRLSVEIFGQLPDPPFDTRECIEGLADQLWEWAHGRLGSLVIAAGEQRMFAQMVHHRALRFSTDRLARLVTLDASISVFDEVVLGSHLNVGCRNLASTEASEHRALEERLRKLADRGIGLVRRS